MITFALCLVTVYAWGLAFVVWVLARRASQCVCQFNPRYDPYFIVAILAGQTMIVFAAVLKTNGVWL